MVPNSDLGFTNIWNRNIYKVYAGGGGGGGTLRISGFFLNTCIGVSILRYSCLAHAILPVTAIIQTINYVWFRKYIAYWYIDFALKIH